METGFLGKIEAGLLDGKPFASRLDYCVIQHYLGHKNMSHTVRHTELSPKRFKDFWQD